MQLPLIALQSKTARRLPESKGEEFIKSSKRFACEFAREGSDGEDVLVVSTTFA